MRDSMSGTGGFRFDSESLSLLEKALTRLAPGFENLPAVAGRRPAGLSAALAAAAARLRDNYPYFHPLYAGQMLKPPHAVARLAYSLALFINPNNHALDGGRASSAMEREAVAELARMIGWGRHLGHLTGGGTMANLEALWVSGRLSPGQAVVASEQAHYTHSRISGVLALPFEALPCDDRGRLDTQALEERLVRGGVGTVVVTLGTTATGSVDPLPAILDLKRRFGFRLHADAAYGGYFGLAGNLGAEARAAYSRLPEADSVVIDPHKHGLQPYGCGCVLFKDPSVGRFYKHDSPYTYFSSDDLHLGEISLECSRAGASAVALWATQRLFTLRPGGDFARGLEAGREAALGLHARIGRDPRFVPAFAPELDIVVWAMRGKSTREASALARRVFDEAARRNLHLALAELPARFFGLAGSGAAAGGETVTCLRSVLMKPEHLPWLPRIWKILDEATSTVLGEKKKRGAEAPRDRREEKRPSSARGLRRRSRRGRRPSWGAPR
jgi:tyrosine decarboxylase/aspartate 1-decarboxylase